MISYPYAEPIKYFMVMLQRIKYILDSIMVWIFNSRTDGAVIQSGLSQNDVTVTEIPSMTETEPQMSHDGATVINIATKLDGNEKRIFSDNLQTGQSGVVVH